MNNETKFAKTVILVDDFLKITGNHFKALGLDAFDGKGKTPNGVRINALIMEDNAPAGFYGLKKDGITPREGVLFQNITLTIINGNPSEILQDMKVGDEFSVFDFDPDNSYFINYSLILRFRRCERYKKGANNNAEHAGKN
jgi:hypothetical protein